MAEIRTLPLVPLKNTVIFPVLAYPVSVVKESTVRAVDAALLDDGAMAVFTLRDPEVDSPLTEELFDVGSMVRIVKNIRMPAGKRSVILEGEQRIELIEVFVEDDVLYAKVNVLESTEADIPFEKKEDLRRLALQVFESSSRFSSEAGLLLRQHDGDIDRLTDIITMQLGLSLFEKQDVLSTVDLSERVDVVMGLLKKSSNWYP